jgi:hypothetical protein
MPKGDEQDVTTGTPAGEIEEATSSVVQAAEEVLRPSLPQNVIEAHLREDLQDLLVANSLGTGPAALALHRYIPAEIYVSGPPDENDIVFLDLAMALVEFAHKIDWEVHTAAPIQLSSIRKWLTFRTNQRLTLEESEDSSEMFEWAFAEGVKAEHKTVALEERKATIRLKNAQAQLARAKTFRIYSGVISGVITAFLALSPGSYVQIGTTRVERGSDVTVSIKHVPASTAFEAHLGARPPADSEKHETK